MSALLWNKMNNLDADEKQGWTKVGGRYRFGEWSAPDPHDHALHDALHAARYNLRHMSQGQAYRVLAAAEAYVLLTTHPAGQEAMVRKLRTIRRAIRGEQRARQRAEWLAAHPPKPPYVHPCKVSKWQRYHIYWRLRGGAATARQLAAEYGVHLGTIYAAAAWVRRLYAHQGRSREPLFVVNYIEKGWS